jgi:nicotinamidase-related amidase
MTSSATGAPGTAVNAASYGLSEIRPAVLTIDMHRGHLDPDVATMPLPAATAATVTATNVEFLGAARRSGLPVVHLVTRYRDVTEIDSNPFWRSVADTSATRRNVRRHNLEDSPGLELMPGILDAEHDVVVDTKKRYDCFVATDLAFVLDTLGVNTLLITGVNTNSCVLATTVAASVRDFACIILSDCVDTVDGAELHDAALACLSRAFGWVMPWRKALQEVAPGQAGSADAV